jgi:hypothetical protein
MYIGTAITQHLTWKHYAIQNWRFSQYSERREKNFIVFLNVNKDNEFNTKL